MEINKNMGKKALALLLCALMIIGFMPIKAHAAVISGDGYSYDDVTDILTISSNAIVNNWDNYEFVDYTQVKHLVIEDSVTNITSYAFYAWDTTSLESVIISTISILFSSTIFPSLFVHFPFVPLNSIIPIL